MKTSPALRLSLVVSAALLCPSLARAADAPLPANAPINVDTPTLHLTVDPATCRWSAQVKNSPMQLNDVHFLPGDDPIGWTVSASLNTDDATTLGNFTTVTLRGTKPGQLDFTYQISAAKTGADLLVSLGRANNTGKSVDLNEMDYFISGDARLGGTTDKWIDLGTHSRNRDYYDLWAVTNLITPKEYEVNHVVQDSSSGNSLLLGQITTAKGASRFTISSGWQGKTPDRMQIRGYCSYKITMPAGKAFPGEKLLIDFNTDALRAMEHQADLIALAHDIRLKTRRPINLDDKELVANNYSRYHGWMSGGSDASARKFFQDNGLTDFYWGMGGPGAQGSFGFYGMGGGTQGRPSRVTFPADCYLPVPTVRFGGEKVVDFSNPKAINMEHDRAFQWATAQGNNTGRAEMDFADWWDKWPGQFDPYMTAMETYHAGGMPWREAIDQKDPRLVVRSNMNVIDHSYGIVDICRTSEDADHGYETLHSAFAPAGPSAQTEFQGLFWETVMGSTNRFFYSGRVFWNDGDGFHIYKYANTDGKDFTAGEAKVDANFHAFACNALFLSEALNVPYPPDRVELLKRICPPTMDTSYPVDIFQRKPAHVWNMPVERPFGKWNVLAVFNFTGAANRTFTTRLDAAKDLRLDPAKDYIVYEFWSKKLLGTFKGAFATRALAPYDCDIYSIVEKTDHPTLISTSRHIRQMAFDIKALAYTPATRTLEGTSRATPNDPYQLRIYVPEGFTPQRVEISDNIPATMKTEGNLLTVDLKTTTAKDLTWKVVF